MFQSRLGYLVNLRLASATQETVSIKEGGRGVGKGGGGGRKTNHTNVYLLAHHSPEPSTIRTRKERLANGNYRKNSASLQTAPQEMS